MIDPLKSLGIEKGKPFNPERCHDRRLLNARREGAGVAGGEIRRGSAALLRRTAAGRSPRRRTSSRQRSRATRTRTYPIDARGIAYSYAFIGIKRLGAGPFYLISISDKDGDTFDGGKTYRLTVPRERAGRAVLVGDGL